MVVEVVVIYHCFGEPSHWWKGKDGESLPETCPECGAITITVVGQPESKVFKAVMAVMKETGIQISSKKTK